MSARRFFVTPALFLLTAIAAQAGWTVTAREAHAGKDGFVTRVAVEVEESETAATARLQLAVFDSTKTTLRVLDQPAEPRVALAALMQANDCLAGVNGGYFDPDYAPVGMLVSDGRVVLGRQKARLLSGIVSVVNGRLRIQRAGDFPTKAKASAARQCGPFLVENAKPMAGLNDERSARRTFVLVAEKGKAALGFASNVTLAQLGALLSTPGLDLDLKVQNALNLDGGSSSAFWFAGEERAFSIREQKRVRDYLAIVPKP